MTTPSTKCFGTAVLCMLLCVDAFAHGQVVRGPVLDDGSNAAQTIDGEGVLELNAARLPFVTSKGMHTVTYARVDTAGGSMGGYAEMSMDSSAVLTVGSDAVGASAGSILQAQDFTLVNHGGGAAVVDATFEFEFDGRFLVHSGTPTLMLTGALSVVTLDSFEPPAFPNHGLLHLSTLSFLASAANPGVVEVLAESSQTSIFGPPVDNSPFAGASHEVPGATTNDLRATLRMVVSLREGDTFTLIGSLFGLAAPEPDPDDDDIEDGLSVLASAGAVDFSNTGTLRVFLPAGYSFDSDDALLDNITVQSAPVPLPGALLLLAPAVALLACRRRVSAGG